MSRKVEVLSIAKFLKLYGSNKSVKKLIKDTLFENGRVKVHCVSGDRKSSQQMRLIVTGAAIVSESFHCDNVHSL